MHMPIVCRIAVGLAVVWPWGGERLLWSSASPGGLARPTAGEQAPQCLPLVKLARSVSFAANG